MSSPQTPSSGRPPKTMSSRLLTMKFMQRAAASNPTTPSTPASDAAQPPSSKRRKVSNHSTPSTPATPLTEQAAIQAALDAEEAKREEALERIAAERGETKWVLSFVDDGREKAGGLRVSRAGYGDIDGGEVRETGRMKFGKGWKVEKPSNGATHNSSSSSSGEVSDEVDGTDSEDADGAGDLIRQEKEEAAERAKAERKANKKAEKAEATKMAERRRSKEVNVNKLSSISTGGGWRPNIPANEDRGRKRKGGYDGHRQGKKPRKEEVLDY